MAPSFAYIPWLPKDTWVSFRTGCSFNFVLHFFNVLHTRNFYVLQGLFLCSYAWSSCKAYKESGVCLSLWLRWVSRNVEFLGGVAKHRQVCNCRRDYCVAVMCLLRKYRTYIRRRSWMPAWCVDIISCKDSESWCNAVFLSRTRISTSEAVRCGDIISMPSAATNSALPSNVEKGLESLFVCVSAGPRKAYIQCSGCCTAFCHAATYNFEL